MNSLLESLYQKAKQAINLYKEKCPDDTEAIAIFESVVIDIEDLLSEEAE